MGASRVAVASLRTCPAMLDKRDLEIARLQRACQASGRAGLNALMPRQALAPEQAQMYAKAMLNWLNREMGSFEPRLECRYHKFTLSFNKGPHLQLRFSPRFCRWILLVRCQRYWWPHIPDSRKRCLSLCDWLGQVRRLITGRCPLPTLPQ